MPRRSDLNSVLIIGSGPIVIGQACEFDYSGTQACKVLKQEGLRVVLVNSNPATIMTDPELCDATYVEPITPEVIEKVIARERPDACLPTLGGQTALNAAIGLEEAGVLEAYGVELIGANSQAIHTSTMYTAASGATVFAAGTFQWSWAIDRFGSRAYNGHPTPYDERVVRMTRNLFDRLGDGPATAVLRRPGRTSDRRP